MKNRLALIILAATGVGLAVSVYTTAHNAGAVSGGFCNLSDVFSCDVVNRGEYSQVFGVPVAVIGLIGYGILALGAFLKWRDEKRDRALTAFLVLASAGGMGFALYLTGVEAFILRTWCILCLTSQAAILTAFVAAVLLWYHERNVTT